MNVTVEKYCSSTHLTTYCLVKCHKIVMYNWMIPSNNRQQLNLFSPRSGTGIFSLYNVPS